MPFTPLHMGPALAVKAATGQHFSLMIFGFSQVAMDIEPLVRILRDDHVLHGFSHSYLGATFIAVISIIVGRPICQFLLNRWTPKTQSTMFRWLPGPPQISWPAAISGAFIGTYSHVLLDSIMHDDMRPLAPFSQENALLHIISTDALQLACVLSGLLGATLYLMICLIRRRMRK